ncbi:MAG: hypothetical protein WC523_00515 [Patescibacteria group bacterium]
MVLRNSWYDGQQVVDTDLNVEQEAWHNTIANTTNISIGSGVEKETAVQTILFDSSDAPASISSLITDIDFDGTPIYEEDDLGNVVFIQPSDTSKGNMLDVEISGSNLLGYLSTKVFIFGEIFGGTFVYEVLTFTKNETQTTKNYFTKILAFMTQDFRGNGNTLITGTACIDNGGVLKIYESVPMTVVRDVIMAEQIIEPSMDFIDFKPSNMSVTLGEILDEIAAVDTLNVEDLQINITAAQSRSLSEYSTDIIGEKFLAKTNNIQKVSVLLSVEEDTLAVAGHEYDWTGNITLEIRKLQTTTACPTDITPESAIEFDPEPSSLAEMSFSQAELEDLGIVLDSSPKVVDFVFTRSAISNPSTSTITDGQYYILTIRRTGDTSSGTFILPEATNISADSNMILSIFSQNKWTDIDGSNLWFRVYTSAVRVTSGTAYDNGIQIISQKIVKDDITGIEVPYSEGAHSLLSTSPTVYNYMIVQAIKDYSTPVPHPATGNQVFTRIDDVPSFSIVSESSLTALVDSGDETIVLANVRDTNPSRSISITGMTDFPGLLRTNTFTIIQPDSDLTLNNLVGSILTPNTSLPNLKYRIIKSEIFEDAYGDVDADGTIDAADVTRAIELDGYSTGLVLGTVASADQKNAIVNGTVDIEEIIRADVTGDSIISVADAVDIQDYVSSGGVPFDVGSTLTRLVLTVENIDDTTPDMIADDASFNDVPFSAIEYEIELLSIWVPENIIIEDMRRFISKSFTTLVSDDITGSDKNGGENTSSISGDLLLGGNLLNEDGTDYSVDFEVGQIIIDLPAADTQGDIDIFDTFIKDKMKFYDGTYVGADALNDNQVRVSVGLQSLSADSPAYVTTCGLLYTQSTGLLRINIIDANYSSISPELRTKIILTVYLKKAGFLNTEANMTGAELADAIVPF